jgi:Lon-like protease
LLHVRGRWSWRNPWSRRLLLLALTSVVGGLALWLVPTAWYITAPGAAIDTATLVAVRGGLVRPGHLYMMVVTTQPANLFWYLYAKLDPRAQLETPQQFLGDVEDYGKYVELARRMMADSQQAAMAVAEHQAGYGQGARSVGVELTDLTAASPARGFLLAGDVIVRLQEQAVTSLEHLRAIMLQVPAGAPVSVRVRRGGQELDLTVPTVEHTDPARKGTAQLGIYGKDALLFDVPVPVEIKAGAISGPSAGLMFTLQIIDQLTPGGIVGDLVVAGTGTIEHDGTVGAIGGVKQKVFAAEAAGARVFFAPEANYADARSVATRIEVVQVEHVRDALTWLKAHR